MNHIALEVGDLDEALAFWESIFGELELRGRIRGMAFIDMGDQFIALARGRTQAPDRARHFGLVVDDKEAVRARLQELDIPISPGRGLDFSDPWGNQIQVVDYRDVQFTKTPEVLQAMGLDGLEKSESALAELRKKGVTATASARTDPPPLPG
jgi:catechol 2,3-dioxygenase-like lactoylglutathione lyase family enzyme